MEAQRANGVPEEGGGSGFATGPYAPSAGGRALADPGFAGTCNTTLVDWIQLVQLGRRDAVVTVRSEGGRRATLWCRSGNIIDASCDGLVGEDAVYRVLAWRTGEVSLDFGSVEHRCAIDTPTTGLLIEAMVRKDEALEADGPDGPSQGDVTTLDVVPRWSPLPGASRRWLEWSLWGAGMLLSLVLIGAAISKGRAPAKSHDAAAQGKPPGFCVVPLPARAGGVTPASRRRPSALPVRPSAPAFALLEEVPPVVTDRPAKPKVTVARTAARQSAATPVAFTSIAASPPIDVPSPHRRPNIRIIEDGEPRVRIIDEHEAHVDVVE